MKLSNIASTLLLLAATGELVTHDAFLVAAKTSVGRSSRNSLRAAVEDSARFIRQEERQSRFLEENNEEEDENAADEEEEEEGNDDANYNQDEDSSSQYTYNTGYIAATSCNSYKVEAEEDNTIDMVLKWNQAYGNWLEVFHVAQKSFVLFDYVDRHNKTHSTNTSQNNDIRKESSYVTDLDTWIEIGSEIGLKKQAYPSCTLIEDPATIFQTNDDKNDDITKFLNTASLANNNYFEDWYPQLYLGPICGMGDGALNWGIFLDDTCTTYVPKWSYRYRNLKAAGLVSYDSNAKTLLSLGGYTKSNGNHWSCKKGDGFCDSILSYSADTMYCKVPGKDYDEEERRQLANDDSVSDYYFKNGYQISQDNLEDIESSCGAVITSYARSEGDLTGYLEHYGQLEFTKNFKKGDRTIVEFTVLTLVLFAVVVGATMAFRRRRPRVQQVPPAKLKGGAEKKKMESERKTSTKQEPPKVKKATPGKKAKTTSGKKAKKQGGWFGSGGKKKSDSKKKRLLDVEIEV